MSGGINVLARHFSAHRCYRQRFSCGAAQARLPVTTYADATSARSHQQQHAPLQSQPEDVTQHILECRNGHRDDLASIKLDHSGVVLLRSHDVGQVACSSDGNAGVQQPQSLLGTQTPAILLPPSESAHRADRPGVSQLPADLTDVEPDSHQHLNRRHLHHRHHHYSLQTSTLRNLQAAQSRDSSNHRLPLPVLSSPDYTRGPAGAVCAGTAALAAQPQNSSGGEGHASDAVSASDAEQDLLPYLDASSRSGGVASTSQPAGGSNGGGGEHWRDQRRGTPGGPSPPARKPPKRSRDEAQAAAAMATAVAAAATASLSIAPGLHVPAANSEEAASGGVAYRQHGDGGTRSSGSRDDGAARGIALEEGAASRPSSEAWQAPGKPAAKGGEDTAPAAAADESAGDEEKGAMEEANDTAKRIPASAPRAKRPRAPSRAQHEELRLQAALRRQALRHREPTYEDVRLSMNVCDAAHWREVLALVSGHMELHERRMAAVEQRQEQQEWQQQQQLAEQSRLGPHVGPSPSVPTASSSERVVPPLGSSPRPSPLSQEQQDLTHAKVSARQCESPPRFPHADGAPPGLHRLRTPASGSPPGPVPISQLPFTPQHVAIILHRTAQLVELNGGPHSRAEAMQLHGMLDALARLAGAMVPSPGMTLRDISVILYSLVRLRRPLGNPFILSLMCAARDRFSAKPPRPPPRTRAPKARSKATAAAAAAAPPADAHGGAPEAPKAATALHLALLLWSVSRCGMKGLRADWAGAYCKALAAVVPELSAQGVAIALYGMARLRFTPPPPLAAALCARLTDLTGGSVGDSKEHSGGKQPTATSSGSQSGQDAGRHGAGSAGAAVSAPGGYTQQESTDGVQPSPRAAGTVSDDRDYRKLQPAAVQGQVKRRGQGKGRSRGGKDQTELQRGANGPGVRCPTAGSPEDASKTAAPPSADGSAAPGAYTLPAGAGTGPSPPPRGQCRPGDVSMTLWALATLSLSPDGLCPDLLPAVLRFSQATMYDFREQELSNLVWALARLQHVPPPAWIACLYGAVYAQLPYLGPQALATVLYGLEQMGQRPEAAWMGAVAWRARELLPWSSPQSLALTIHALAVLGFRPERAWLAAFHARLEAQPGQLDNRVRDKVRRAYRLLDFRPGDPGPAAQPTAPAAAGARGQSSRASGAGADTARSRGSAGAGARAAAGADGTALWAAPSRWGSGTRDVSNASDIRGSSRNGDGGAGGQRMPSAQQDGTDAEAQQLGAAAQAHGQDQELAWALDLERLEGGLLGDASSSWEFGLRPADEVATQVLVRPSRFV